MKLQRFTTDKPSHNPVGMVKSSPDVRATNRDMQRVSYKSDTHT